MRRSSRESAQAARERWTLDEVRAVFLLLQADARRWTLDAAGLPDEAMRMLATPAIRSGRGSIATR